MQATLSWLFVATYFVSVLMVAVQINKKSFLGALVFLLAAVAFWIIEVP